MVDGTTVHNAGGAITNIDGRVTQNTIDITNLDEQLNQHRQRWSGAARHADSSTG